MAAAIALRRDYDAYRLRVLAKQSDDADQTRRLLALATIYDGGSRGDAAELAGVGLQTLRDWVLRFNAAGPSGLLNGKAPGRQPLLDDRQRRELADAIERGPIPAVDGVVRWSAGNLGSRACSVAQRKTSSTQGSCRCPVMRHNRSYIFCGLDFAN